MIKTVKVKLHNPSNHKRAVLDRVFLRWTLAADMTLRWAEEHLDAFENCKDHRGNYRGNLIAGVLNQHLRSEVKHFGLHNSLEDALWRDIGKTLAAYFALLKEDPNAGFPTIPRAKPNPKRYEAALAELGSWGAEEQRGEAEGNQIRNTKYEIRNLQGELHAAARDLEFQVRPIHFANPDAVPKRRGYSILYDEESDRYVALLYLLPRSASNRYRKPLTLPRPLLALNKHAEYLVETGRPSGAFLFPLEMGSWQKETFFDPALDDPEIIRTAYLTRSTNEQAEVAYYLHIAVDLPPAEPIEPVNFLGVHHTLQGEIFALVVEPNGEVLHYEHIAHRLELEDVLQQRQARQRRGKRTSHRVARERTKHHYHIASNRIVALAKEYCAHVGVEDLSYVRTKTRSKGLNRLLLGAPVGELSELLSYKLPFAGLPAPLQVGGISPRECHRCGKESRERTARAEGRISCPLCGLEMDVHENNTRLVAARVPQILERIKKKTFQ